MNAMKVTWISLTGLLVVLAIAVVVFLDRLSDSGEPAEQVDTAPMRSPLRLGLIPERDIFKQRKRYRTLADYVAARLDRPVELVTSNTYEGILDDFRHNDIDLAFLGSLVTTLAMDRHGVSPIVKPELSGGITTYHGVILVRADSSILKVEDLAGKSIAMVKATTAGDLFPISEMMRTGVLDASPPPEIRWVGTHDAVIAAVAEGAVDAGAAKSLRLDAFEASRGGPEIRRLAIGADVPNNALIGRPGLEGGLASQLERILLAMESDPEAAEVLKAFGAVRFVPCDASEYAAVYDMVDSLAGRWDMLEVSGPPPSRPEGLPGEG